MWAKAKSADVDWILHESNHTAQVQTWMFEKPFQLLDPKLVHVSLLLESNKQIQKKQNTKTVRNNKSIILNQRNANCTFEFRSLPCYSPISFVQQSWFDERQTVLIDFLASVSNCKCFSFALTLNVFGCREIAGKIGPNKKVSVFIISKTL